ncbi:MAG: hypothetical protein GX644_04395 [Limnobacter sp.]|nr:hypothetical protein [Limnobacter sp.]
MKPRHAVSALAALGLAAVLAGCGEKPQVSTSAAVEVPGARASDEVAGNRVTRDTKAWEGDALPYQAGNFQRGDAVSWQKALDARVQGQNEYIRIGSGK